MSICTVSSRFRVVLSAGLLSASLSVALIVAPRAGAELAPASVIDGPSSTILDVDGAAMAPDGSGGILYRKLLDGQPHLFVSRFSSGAWQPPVEVDQGQPYGASFPVIAAGNGGRLLVAWAEPFATKEKKTEYELMSAELEPGAEQFGPAIQIDPSSIGDASAAYPSLAVAPNGQAYVAYRVVTNSLVGSTIIPLKPGDELISVRVARYNGVGLNWTSLGAINIHPSLTMRHPSASNAPAIGVTLNGNAVVTWQEPDSSGTARIWVRRLFGNRLGNPLEVSPESVGGRPITAEADAPTIAVNGLGEARIAYRLAGGAGSPYSSPRILLATLPSEVDPNGAKLEGAVPVGGASSLGVPSLALDESGAYRLAYNGGGDAQQLSGDNYQPSGAPSALGPENQERALTSINPAGGGVTAWPATSGSGLPVIDAREDFSQGAFQLAQLSAPLSGPLGSAALGGSGRGDALIAFSQGPPDQQQVMAAVAKAPPSQFLAVAPSGWVSGSSATISWEAPSEAFGTTTYTVLVDGRVVAHGLTGLSTRLSSSGLGDGKHQVQVLATDSLGQETATPDATLKVDANPPGFTLRHLGGRRVRVRVFDRASGTVAGKTLIVFGDGTRVKGKLSVSHTYGRPGRYVIVVHSRDRVGHTLAAHLRVQIE